MTRPTCATTALGTLKQGVHEYKRKKEAAGHLNPGGSGLACTLPTLR